MSDKYSLVRASQLPGGNIEITRDCREGRTLRSMFSKIITDPQWNILAYVDVKMIPRQRHVDPFFHMISSYDRASKDDRWFGIEEFHPEIMGDFNYEMVNEPIFDNEQDHIQWIYNHSKNMYNLYVFGTKGTGTCFHQTYHLIDHWYKVEAGQITTNVRPTFAPSDNFTYAYNTRPSEPSDFVKKCVNLAKENYKVKAK